MDSKKSNNPADFSVTEEKYINRGLKQEEKLRGRILSVIHLLDND